MERRSESSLFVVYTAPPQCGSPDDRNGYVIYIQHPLPAVPRQCKVLVYTVWDRRDLKDQFFRRTQDQTEPVLPVWHLLALMSPRETRHGRSRLLEVGSSGLEPSPVYGS